MDETIEVCVVVREERYYFVLKQAQFKFSDLKQYFPDAVGLSYYINQQRQIVDIIDGGLQLCRGIYEYNLLFTEGNIYYRLNLNLNYCLTVCYVGCNMFQKKDRLMMSHL